MKTINYNLLQGIPEENRQLFTKILVDSVKHPRKYAHVINLPGLHDCKELLKEMGYNFKQLK